MFKNNHKYIKALRRKVAAFVEKNFGFDLMRYGVGFFNKSNQISYDEAWNKILTRKPETATADASLPF